MTNASLRGSASGSFGKLQVYGPGEPAKGEGHNKNNWSCPAQIPVETK